LTFVERERLKTRAGRRLLDFHQSLILYDHYYDEAKLFSLWKMPYKLIRESLQGYYLGDLVIPFGWPSFTGQLNGASTGQVTYVSERHVIPFVESSRSRYYIMTVIVEVSLSLLRIYIRILKNVKFALFRGSNPISPNC